MKELSPQSISSSHGAKKTSKRLGRGNASQKGTSAGRGTKGQRARSGGKSRTSIRALRHSVMKVPKLRGWTSMYKKPELVTLRTLARVAQNGDTVSPDMLLKKGAISRIDRGVKIVGTTAFDKKVMVKDCLASKGALALIEKAGGTVTF